MQSIKWFPLALVSAGVLALAGLSGGDANPPSSLEAAPGKVKHPAGAAAVSSKHIELTAAQILKMPLAPAKAVVKAKEMHKKPPPHPKLPADILAKLPRHDKPEGAGALKLKFGPDKILPIVATSWEASGGLNAGGFASDSQIAVSTTHVVVTSRGVLAFYNRAGKLLQGPTGTGTFFNGIDLVSSGKVGGFNDCRAIFDPFRKRFFIVCLGHATSTATRPQILCAVSKNENPLDGFFLYHWDGAAWESGVAHKDDDIDYPCLGVDSRFHYQTNAVNDGKGFRYWHVIFFDANQMAQGGAAAGWHYYGLQHPDGNAAWLIQPVLHHGPSPHGFLVSRFDVDKVIVWALTDGLKKTQTLQSHAVTVSPYQNPVDAPQLGSATRIEMTNLGTGIIKAVWRNHKLYMVGNDARGWGDNSDLLTSIRLLRFNVQNYPTIPTTSASGFIDRAFGKAHVNDPAGTRLHYGWPGIEVNKNGDMAIVYARIGKTVDPEVRVSLYHANEPDISPSMLVKKGEAAYAISNWPPPLPWGDTAGACVDPIDDTSIWVSQQYARKDKAPNNNYSVWVTKVYGPTYPWLNAHVILQADKTHKPNAALPLEVHVENHGDGPAKATTAEVHISRKAAVTATDPKIGEFAVPALKSGASQTIKATAKLPANFADGTYHVAVILHSVEREYRAGATTHVAANTIAVKK